MKILLRFACVLLFVGLCGAQSATDADCQSKFSNAFKPSLSASSSTVLPATTKEIICVDPAANVGLPKAIFLGGAIAAILGGPDSATPIGAGIIHAQSTLTGTTNVSAADARWGPGQSTGISAPGMSILQGTILGASGGTQQPYINRFLTGIMKNLTSGAATNLWNSPLASTDVSNGIIAYGIRATDGTSTCAITGTVLFSATNTGGVFSVPTPIKTESTSACTATKTLATVVAITGANPSLVTITPSLVGITATSFTITYSVQNFGNVVTAHP